MKPKAILTILESLMAETTRRFSEKEKALKARTWISKLADITKEQGKAGLDKALEDDMEFMPSVGKFKQMCLSGTGCANLEDQAAEAWAVVKKSLNSRASLLFKDTAIAEAVRKMGGRERIDNMIIFPPEKSEEAFRRNEFIDIYTITKRQKTEFPPMLKGGGFSVNGKHEDQYKFIGSFSKEEKREVVKKIKQQKENEQGVLVMLRRQALTEKS